MPMYAIATVPLINSLNSPVKQIWYADNAATTGKLPTFAPGGMNNLHKAQVLDTMPTLQRPGSHEGTVQTTS